MIKAKKIISLSISEDLLNEVDEIVQKCHNHGFMVNRSDLICASLYARVDVYMRSKEVIAEPRMIRDIQELRRLYYEKYNLTVRRKNGV